MAQKLTTPKDLLSTSLSADLVIIEFEEQLKLKRPNEAEYVVRTRTNIRLRLTKQDENDIILAYKQAGWSDASIRQFGGQITLTLTR